MNAFLRLPLPCFAAALCFALPALLSAGDWPQFRGPTGMGLTPAENLPLEWGGPEDRNVLWKAPLPTTGQPGDADHNQSSPVVVDGRVFVTAAQWKPEVDKRSTQPVHHVACYDAATGELLWDRVVPAGPLTMTDLRGGYATATPAVADGRVVAMFGSGAIHALDFEGELVWSHIIKDHDQFDVAICSSPIIHKGTVIQLLDRKNPLATIIGLDLQTGEPRWEKKRPETDFGHMTPLLADVGGDTQLLVTATHDLQGLDPESGDEIWSCDWGRGIWPVSTPVVADGLVYAIGGRGGHPGVVVDPTGKGDVTDTHVKWRIQRMSEGLSSPAAFEDRVYRLHSPGVIRAVKIADGTELFTERLPNANPAVSPVVTPQGRIYFASAGKSVIIEAGDELKVLAESDLGDSSDASPAVADGVLYLKGQKYLWAIGEGE